MNEAEAPAKPSMRTISARWRRGFPPFRLLPGVGLSAALAVIAIGLGSNAWLASHGISALTAAIALGIVAGNTFYPRTAARMGTGVAFSKQTLLRTGVVLYGLRLTLHDVGQVGAAGILIDALVLTSTFILAITLGTRFFGLGRELSMLIGAGSAICGAAAVMATEPVVRARANDVTLAVSTVVIFGTVAMFLYPVLYQFMPHGPDADASRAFGVYTGSTIHEVAQVLAAGRSVSDTVANTAVITKMVRVMMLAPFLMALSGWIVRSDKKGSGAHTVPETRPAQPASVPWFAVAFIGMVIFNSFRLLPPRILSAATIFDTFLLATAMAALGLTTRLCELRAAGRKPLCLGAILFLWLIVGGGAINAVVNAWLN